MPSSPTIKSLLNRYRGATTEMLDRIFTPYRLRITGLGLDSTEKPIFRADIPQDVWTTFAKGTTGKVVSREYVEETAPWREIVKARIHDCTAQEARGQLYFPGSGRMALAMKKVKVGDYVEVDTFGVSSKIESALSEAAFFLEAKKNGFRVTRMPENVAMHIGTQGYFDFLLEKQGSQYRIELKSLWGTDTTKARLIHTVSRKGSGGKNTARQDRQIWSSSSCRFQDQDIFAVALWLRTGSISEFAYSLSIPTTISARWGLPPVLKYPTHVTQNPPIATPPKDPWTPNLQEICERYDSYQKGILPD